MFSETDLLPISALQHLAFCERQWALIHLEGVWDENVLTAEGRSLHEKTHQSLSEARPGGIVARGLRLRSLALGLVGQADVVEFYPAAEGEPGVSLPGRRGPWRPFPVEYKRGKPKKDLADKIQLCAQGLCLEEMLGGPIPEGALFYGKTRKRLNVVFDSKLRDETMAAARRLHGLQNAGSTPPAQFGPKCKNCSLIEACLPHIAGRKSARRYIDRALNDLKG